MNTFQRPDSLQPGEFMQVLRRRAWIVVALVVLCALGSLAYLKVAPKKYTATASVYVTATGANSTQVTNGRTSGSVDMDSEAQLVQSVAVATLAAHALHTTIPPTTLSTNVTVTVPPNSQVLQITCAQRTADSAAACAQAFASAYLQNRSATATSQLNGELKPLQGQQASLQHDVANQTTKVASLPPNSAQRAAAQVQLSSDNSQLTTISQKIGSIQSSLADTSGGSIITSAQPPTKPASPEKKIVIPSGLVVGLLVGLILAFWVEHRDHRVRGPGDLQRYLDLPVLLDVPTRQRHPQPSLAAPRSHAGRMFAELADSATAALGDGHHVLFVTGASPGAGTSVAAASLAAALARTHSEVILVCADLNNSVIPELLGLHRGPGLAEVLAEKATFSEAAQLPVNFARLEVITPGIDTSLVLYDFQHEVNRQLISDLRRHASMVVIEAQSAGTGADTFSLAEFADTALIVAEVGNTKRSDIADAVHRLGRLRTPVLGAMLVPYFRGSPAPPGGLAKTAERAAVSADVRPAVPQRDLPRPLPPSASPARGDKDLGETRPLPRPIRQAMADQRASHQFPGRTQVEPNRNAEG